MKEYSMNGILIIGIDNGYGNTKSAHTVMRTSVEKSDSTPAFSKDYLEYEGSYYILSEGHKSFVADKVLDGFLKDLGMRLRMVYIYRSRCRE